MTQEFDGAALSVLNQSYGLSGVDAEQQTFLDDGNVSQVLDIGPVSRRGNTPFHQGIFWAHLLNAHPGVGELQSFINPYNPVFPAGNFPSPVDPTRFDIWFFGCSVHSNSGGAAAVEWAQLGIDLDAPLMGMSDTAAGGALTPADEEVPLQVWTDFTTVAATNGNAGLSASGVVFQPFKMRLPPDTEITFRTQVTGAANLQAFLQFGIFPVGLGQDFVV